MLGTVESGAVKVAPFPVRFIDSPSLRWLLLMSCTDGLCQEKMPMVIIKRDENGYWRYMGVNPIAASADHSVYATKEEAPKPQESGPTRGNSGRGMLEW